MADREQHEAGMPPGDPADIRAVAARLAGFSRERGWNPSPKNLSMALAVEAAELLEIFQWKTEQESRDIAADAEALRSVRHELADIAIYVLNICNALDIDLPAAIQAKVALNAARYPVRRGNR